MVISGAIGRSGWFYSATSAQDVRDALQDVSSSTIRVKLNSGGGDADQGIEIYNYLKDLDKYVIVEVTSLAASAASIIAMGADEIIMRTGSRMMVHEASTFAWGTKQDIQKTLNALETYDESIISIYEEKTGNSRSEIKKLIEAETWMTAEQAVEKGFADRVEKIKDEEPQTSNGITDEQIQMIKNSILNELKQNENQIQGPISASTPSIVDNKSKRKRFF
ncbi:Clp protease ClpP [Lysinibacillus yapensis]|uniref:ATP-dependent Clp protease proteolytic subunit n=2 Tax=Ureibacillus yapensis TaxID=2304605 RepID=A0A396SCL6_9BACL|nr:Clp protease ClpP [Lysinibacillus yapensis]